MGYQKGYRQFCPVAKAAEIVAERWTPLVIRELLSGSRRFNEIQRGVPLMSPSLLSQRLRELQRAGIVQRSSQGRQRTYELTRAGEELRPVIEQLGMWGHRWVQRTISEKDLDPSLLMWDVRRRCRAEVFPSGQTVVEFQFTDVAGAKGSWWLLVETGEIDLCLTFPGHEVDLTVRSDIRTLTEVWMGHRKIRDALKGRQIQLEGEPERCRSFSKWFGLSLFAEAGSPGL